MTRVKIGLIAAVLVATGFATSTAPAMAAGRDTNGEEAATIQTILDVKTYDVEGNLISKETIRTAPEVIEAGLPGDARAQRAARPMDSGMSGTFAASGCRTINAHNVVRTTLGATAFRFHSSLGYCWNFNKQTVTKNASDTWTSDVDPFYRWIGVSGSVDRKVNNGYESFRQGHFKNCIPREGCISNWYAGNTLTGLNNGYWTWETNG